MEDLIPLLIFLVVIAANVIKFFAEKGKPAKPAQEPGEAPPKRRPSSLEKFFESLAEQVAPKPTELPDWPEGHERPDYVEEMEEFEQEQAEVAAAGPTAEIIPMPSPVPAMARRAEMPEFHPLEKPGVVTPPPQTSKAILSGAQGMRMPCMNPFNHTATGHTDFRVKGKKALRQAMLAHIVFSPPRAFDLSFDNTIS